MHPIIEINQFNVNTGIVKRHKDELHSNTKWHKIIVENVENLTKLTVLNAIMKFCYPLHFIPVHYQLSKNRACFLLKNCGSAIERMCSQNLIIKNPFNIDKPFKIAIQLSTASTENFKVNIQDNVTKILDRRYNEETSVLNLENFVNDPDLEEFCPLSQPKLLFYILHLSRNIPFKYLKLCNNEIESLKPIEALAGKVNLISVDLRNNSIPSMAEIIHMQEFQLKELWLDGNPLCDKFDEFTYGRDAKRYLNTLQKLDGVNIKQRGFLPFRRNYLCNQTGFDLVDQFLEHYFTLYDAQNRSVLDGLYHKEAQFSLTSNYLALQSTSIHARLRAYKKISRNLLQVQGASKVDEFLFSGPHDIIKILSSLPQSEHDPFSFTVDLISYTDKLAVLVVSGIFREIKETLFEVERLLNFTRTFVLLAGGNREYTIINEMVHISNATTTQATRAFKMVKPPRPSRIYIPQPKDVKEMLQIVETVKILTGLTAEWSHKCLEECNYNLERALTLFVELYKMDKIPNSAFNSAPVTPGPCVQRRKKPSWLRHKNHKIKLSNGGSVTIRQLLQQGRKSSNEQGVSDGCGSANSPSSANEPTVTSLNSILNEPYEFSKSEGLQQATIVHPILGKIQPQASTLNSKSADFVPPVSRNVTKQIPSRLTTSKSTIQTAPIVSNMQSVNFPLVPPLGNLHPLGMSMPMMPMLNPLKPVIHPMMHQRSIVPGMFGAKPKSVSRISLINIQLNK